MAKENDLTPYMQIKSGQYTVLIQKKNSVLSGRGKNYTIDTIHTLSQNNFGLY